MIELMVAVTIGLVTVAAALGILITTRNVSSMIGDTTYLQQQASFLLRTIGSQIRPAGSLRINLGPTQPLGESVNVREPVALESLVAGFNPGADSLSGIDDPDDDEYLLTVGYRNYQEELFEASVPGAQESQLANCLGQEDSGVLIQSRFRLSDDNELICADSTQSSVLARNVAEFSVRYAIQAVSTDPGDPQVTFTDAEAASAFWGKVVGIEVCLVLFGDEVTDLPADSSYTGCPGASGSMQTHTLADLNGNRRNRTHLTFRNMYQLRAQGMWN